MRIRSPRVRVALAVALVLVVLAGIATVYLLAVASGPSYDNARYAVTRVDGALKLLLSRCLDEPIGLLEISDVDPSGRKTRVVFRAQHSGAGGSHEINLSEPTDGYSVRGSVPADSPNRVGVTRLRLDSGRGLIAFGLRFRPVDVPNQSVLRGDGKVVSLREFSSRKC